MLELNLFHEQLAIQREKDLDPVRWTIVLGSLVVACVWIWATIMYGSMSGLRAELALNQAKLKKLEQALPPPEKRTNLPKIQTEAEALYHQIERRTFIATQLDILKDVIPSHCQIQTFKTKRGMTQIESTIPAAKPGKPPMIVKKLLPKLDITFEVNTQAKNKVEVLQIRDSAIEILRHEPRFREWVKQALIETGATNTQNEITLGSSLTQDSEAGKPAIGIFEFKMQVALKDEPKDL